MSCSPMWLTKQTSLQIRSFSKPTVSPETGTMSSMTIFTWHSCPEKSLLISVLFLYKGKTANSVLLSALCSFAMIRVCCCRALKKTLEEIRNRNTIEKLWAWHSYILWKPLGKLTSVNADPECSKGLCHWKKDVCTRMSCRCISIV